MIRYPRLSSQGALANGKALMNVAGYFCASEAAPSVQPPAKLLSTQAIRQQRPVHHISYPLSEALFLFMDSSCYKKKSAIRTILAPTQSLDYSALLLDSLHPENEIEAIPDIKHDDIMSRYVFEIEKQYHLDETKQQKVGGMGESDGGVWFVPYPRLEPLPVVEPLAEAELIRDTIAVVKQRRHGIPFGVYTSGLVDLSLASKLKDGVGLKRCIVSLGVSNPLSYEKNMFVRNNSVAGDDESPSKQFQSVCSFIALAAESGFPIEVAVLEGNDAAQASDLAKSLGAVNVHTFPPPLGKN